MCSASFRPLHQQKKGKEKNPATKKKQPPRKKAEKGKGGEEMRRSPFSLRLRRGKKRKGGATQAHINTTTRGGSTLGGGGGKGDSRGEDGKTDISISSQWEKGRGGERNCDITMAISLKKKRYKGGWKGGKRGRGRFLILVYNRSGGGGKWG